MKKLVYEHDLIKRWIALIPEVIKNLEVESEEDRQLILDGVDFILSYADKYHHAKMGPIIIGIYIVMVYAAGITGHWKSSMTEHEFSARLKTINSPEITHPAVRFR